MWKICDMRVDKIKAPSPVIWEAGTAEKCQVLLIHTPTDASVHLHAIRGIRSKATQLRQSNMVTHLANWPFLAVRGFYALREHGNYRQHVSIGGSWKFTAMICPDNGLSSGATTLHLANNEWHSKWTTNILDDWIQNCNVGVVIQPCRSVTLDLWHLILVYPSTLRSILAIVPEGYLMR